MTHRLWVMDRMLLKSLLIIKGSLWNSVDTTSLSTFSWHQFSSKTAIILCFFVFHALATTPFTLDGFKVVTQNISNRKKNLSNGWIQTQCLGKNLIFEISTAISEYSSRMGRFQEISKNFRGPGIHTIAHRTEPPGSGTWIPDQVSIFIIFWSVVWLRKKVWIQPTIGHSQIQSIFESILI